MSNNNLPEIFNEFSEARRNAFVQVKELKDKGENIVGVFCAFTPNEIIRAAGAHSLGLCSMSNETIEDAEKDLPKNLCPLIKASYGFAVTDKCPFIYFSDLIVGETTCDGKKKMYEFLGELKPTHVMHLPQMTNDPNSFDLWKNQLVVLKERLEEEFQVEITEEKIRESIKSSNEERKALLELFELGKLCPPPMKGSDILSVYYSTSFSTDKDAQNKKIKDLVEKVKEEYSRGERPVKENAPRILITGCPIGGATAKIIDMIEENGGVVVAYETCGGLRSVSTLVDESEDKDVMDAIAEKYINIGCACMSPNPNRIKLLDKLIDEYKIDGVVDVILQSCHPFSVETGKIKRFVNNEKKIPYMSLETDFSDEASGQQKTRLSAFIEML